MESLKEFIQKYRLSYKPPQDNAQTFDNFLEVNNITKVSEKDCTWFAENICSNTSPLYNSYDGSQSTSQYITEMLETTSPELLKKELNRQLPGNKKLTVGFYSDNDKTKFHQLYIPRERYDIKLIEDICDKYMWVFTAVIGKAGKPVNPHKFEPYYFSNKKFGFEYVVIAVEPVKAKQVNDYVYNDCNGIIYHVTRPENASEILSTGLRVKGSDNTYRFINNRVYFTCGTSQEEIKSSLTKIIRSKGFYKYRTKFRILKLDVSKYNIDFYQDPFYEDNSVYAYTYFPPTIIKDVTNEFDL